MPLDSPTSMVARLSGPNPINGPDGDATAPRRLLAPLGGYSRRDFPRLFEGGHRFPIPGPQGIRTARRNEMPLGASGWLPSGRGPNRASGSAGERVREIGRRPGVTEFPAQKRVFLGGRFASFLTNRPGRGSKPHSGSGSIRLRALLDGQGNPSHRRSGLASGEAAVSPYPDGTSGAPPSPYHRAVSFLLRSSDSRPSGSHPTPCSPKWGLSSAAGRCRHGPPSAALHLLATGGSRGRPKYPPLPKGRGKNPRGVRGS
jgi:hypothetical protein